MTIAVISRGILRIPHLESLLGQPVAGLRWRWLPHNSSLPVAVAGWGLRPSAARARAYAERNGLPYLALEDGFLRSLGLGVAGAPPLSLVVDDLGIYYDASRASRLEQLIADSELTDDQLQQSRRGLAWLRRHRLSKYNHAPEKNLPPRSGHTRVLVLDQTEGDVSVRLGGADSQTFQSMLDAACREHPGAEIWVKTHPDVVAGKKRGYLPQAPAGVHLLAEDVCPQSLLSQVEVVYTATSHMGFEALSAGCRVVCFGMPWYAGWGLTDDRHPGMAALKPRRYRARGLEQLFHAAYLRYARYIQPETGQPGTFFDVAEWVRLNRALREQSRGTLWCVGMSLWKRAVVWPFLKTPDNHVRFVRRLPTSMPSDSLVVGWGLRAPLREQAQSRGLPVLAMEDGFLRSVGLGSNLQPPLSLVVDGGGLYYDYQSDSDLQALLNQARPDADDCARAARLRQRLVTGRISKYNVGSAFRLPNAAAGKKVLLVPGQVEDDASIRTGSPDIRDNLALLQATRHGNPQAWIVYKPHPDVIAGNRNGAVPADTLAALADQVAIDADIADCLRVSDEVHTMTSLAGFEALLQGKTVHCYGAPFYAGWGLTQDHIALPRRRRRLSLDELVHGVLIAYPRYVLPGSLGFSRAEAVVDFLEAQSKLMGRVPLKTKRLAQLFSKGQGIWETFIK
ncbi:capsular polysaccharide biosynthesis protein [Chromobacterium amazonense]|uniref:Capsular polysaccharide biosynthesis protein n=1 Tax=Chromobacterium amazonense TaxID=1382803 RepID=A0ABU8UXA1_9NEIS|nr:capsular polysaccharide biosynthesis protein [Chromobacterium amazonense]MDQ4539188.1 capsular polysaccharide biosynthesis protein [Chromobacterium amazonense]